MRKKSIGLETFASEREALYLARKGGGFPALVTPARADLHYAFGAPVCQTGAS